MKIFGEIKRLSPNYLVGQIALLSFAGVVIYQLVIILMFHILDVEGKRHYVSEAAFITSLFLSIDSSGERDKETLIFEIKNAFPYVNLLILNDRPVREDSRDPVINAELARLKSQLWPGAEVYTGAQHFKDTLGSFVLALRHGGYAVIAISQHKKPTRLLWRWAWEPEPELPFFLTRWARMAFLFLISAGLLIIWLSKTIATPIIELARQAETFPNVITSKINLKPQVPAEVKILKSSIERMQQRILEMIAAQKYMIAAVSHDLRSISTRLKLRAEFIKDEEIRSKINKDLKIMDAMLSQNIQYLLADHRLDSFTLINVDSVLQTVADEFNDAGISVNYSGGAQQQIMGSLTDMLRVFTNLVENAARFSRNISINISTQQVGQITIDIIDDGPGIAPEIIETVFEPFVRGDIGRTLGGPGGFGLGLSIVRSIIRNHGGKIELRNREPNGLLARVTIPAA